MKVPVPTEHLQPVAAEYKPARADYTAAAGYTVAVVDIVEAAAPIVAESGA